MSGSEMPHLVQRYHNFAADVSVLEKQCVGWRCHVWAKDTASGLGDTASWPLTPCLGLRHPCLRRRYRVVLGDVAFGWILGQIFCVWARDSASWSNTPSLYQRRLVLSKYSKFGPEMPQSWPETLCHDQMLLLLYQVSTRYFYFYTRY